MGLTLRSPWTPQRLERLFRPQSIALVGASERSNWAKMMWATLGRTSFPGPIKLINGRGGEVFGQQAVARLTDLTEPVDVAYVMVPGPLVLATVAEASEAGIKNFVVLTSGFAEAGDEGRRAQDELRQLAYDNDLAIIGPNTMGFINVTDGISLMPNSLPGLPRRGRVGLVTQSGALAGATLFYCAAQCIGLSKVLALGNEAVIGAAEVIDYLVDDPDTGAIALMLEAIRSPDLFVAAATRALDAGKPIVVLKAGRSEVAARVAAAHTGAMVGDDRVIDAVFRQLGVIRVASLEKLVTTALVLTRMGGSLGGRRLGVLGISGGACDILADRAEDEGLRLGPFAAGTVKSLQTLVSDYGAINNPLDVTGAAVNQQQLFGNLVRTVAADPELDVLLVQHEIPSAHSGAAEMFAGVLNAAGESTIPAFVVASVGHSVDLDDERFPARGVERIVPGGMDLAIGAIGRAAWWSERYRRARSPRRETPPSPLASLPGRPRRGVWGEARCRGLLEDAGFPLVPANYVTTAEDAVGAAGRHGYPVVVKAAVAGVAHKSDIGGVELGLGDVDEVGDAVTRIAERVRAAGHDLDGWLVSPMRPLGVELIAGVVRNEPWGLVLAVGFGGTWTEVLDDTALRLLPVRPSDVREMLAELRGASLLRAPRGLPAPNFDRIVDAVTALARVAMGVGDDLESIEINPLWVRGDQVEGLDALITWRETNTTGENGDNLVNDRDH